MIGVLRPAWLAYEVRRLGWTGLLLPALIGVPFAGLAALARPEAEASRMLAAYLEAGLPLAAGLAASSATDDPALDLQLSLGTRYLTTVLRRLATLVGLCAALAVLWASAMFLLGLWTPWVPEPYGRGQLVWLPPLLLFVGLGGALALLLRSRSAAGAVLGGYWIGCMTCKDPFLAREWSSLFYPFATLRAPGAGFWLANRLALILSAAVLLLLFAALLRREPVVPGGES